MGIAASGADKSNISNCALFVFSYGQDIQFSTLVLNFNKITSIGIGYGRTEFHFPTCKAIPGRCAQPVVRIIQQISKSLMGIVCGFYRMNNEMIDFLKSNPENAQVYIDENYSSVSGKFHVENDTVFETDKAWDIAKFLLKKCDPSTDKVLQKLDGVPIDLAGDWDGSQYIRPDEVKEIYQVLDQISHDKLIEAYNQQELIKNHVYRADWFDEPNWDYILSHVDTIKKAFSKAAETEEYIVIHFH